MSLSELEENHAFEFYRSFLEFYCSWARPKSYLEIGVRSGETLRRVIPHCGKVTGVDPASHDWSEFQKYSHVCLYQLSSDEYFQMHSNESFDMVFIDGRHEYDQVLRDVRTSLQRLRGNGVVIAHDMLPPSRHWTDQTLCGDAYRVAIELRQDRSLEVYTFPVRYGLTVIGKVGDHFPWVDR